MDKPEQVCEVEEGEEAEESPEDLEWSMVGRWSASVPARKGQGLKYSNYLSPTEPRVWSTLKEVSHPHKVANQ